MRYPRTAGAIGLLVLVGCADPIIAGGDNQDEPPDGDRDVTAIIDDLNDYWAEADAELGFNYVALTSDRISTGDDGVLCDGEEINSYELEENAFVDPGCAEGILMAYDPTFLTQSAARAEATLAHEWGHVIQAQAESLDPSLEADGLPIDAELQADCLAGAWSAERALAGLDALRLDVTGSGDEGLVEIDDPDAHGTGVERVDAFDIGVDGGPAACITSLALPGQ